MLDFAEVCRVVAAVLCLLLAATLLRDHPKDRTAQASVFLLATVIAHLTFPPLLRADASVALIHAVLLVGLSVPFAFWLLAQVHFDDEFRLAPVHSSLLAATVGVGYVSWLIVVEHRATGGWLGPAHSDLWIVTPKLLAVAIMIHAMIRVYVGAGSDLLLPRLRLRYGLLVIAGTYILLELLGELLLRDSASAAAADKLHSVVVLAIVFGASFLALRTSPQILKPARVSLDVPVPDPVLLDRLKKMVEVDEVFRQEGLTIRGLADRLGAPEHRLRELINSQLGFKNFSAFLHRYRIGEAQKALTDPARAHLGVAEVAYAVGYRSLATFNKAFKDLTGRTPTELRASR